MGPKNCLAGLCLAVLAATVIDVPPVEAQTKKQVYKDYRPWSGWRPTDAFPLAPAGTGGKPR
jgi:hypothetical protein